MWVFLVTEIMFFGGLFMAYMVYRSAVADGIPGGQPPPERVLRAPLNTVVLIVSSLTMALGVRAAQTSAPPKTQVIWIVITMMFGAAFLGVKAIEYARSSATISSRARISGGRGCIRHGAEMFYSLYFCMTGLHALHMIIGLGIMTCSPSWPGAAVRRRVLHAGRGGRPLLALRRHRLDFPVPAALPDRPALPRGLTRTRDYVCWSRRSQEHVLHGVPGAARADRVDRPRRRSSTWGR